MIDRLVEQILQPLPKRTQEIISRRLGLETGFAETLEAIGQDLTITRERVRQLESVGFKQINNTLAQSSILDDFFQAVENHLSHFQGLREEKRLLKELSYIFNDEEAQPLKIRFLLFLDKRLFHFAEAEDHSAFWVTDKKLAQKVISLVKKLNRAIRSKSAPLPAETFEGFVKGMAKGLGLDKVPVGILMSYVSLSPKIAFSPFGYIGTEQHLEIAPQNVGEKAYLILKSAGRPMHFRDLTEAMNQHAQNASGFHPVWQKQVEAQTVHNQLIKAGNFVLIGRGTYALSEWGYKPGTVKQVLVGILRKAKQPISFDLIVKEVKKIRLVKESTVFINLQDKKLFKKFPGKKYALKQAKLKAEEA
ncbi:MAG: HTH domain-containing protein [Patescibacteria group bacterium]